MVPNRLKQGAQESLVITLLGTLQTRQLIRAA
jgi:hypothetical protein